MWFGLYNCAVAALALASLTSAEEHNPANGDVSAMPDEKGGEKLVLLVPEIQWLTFWSCSTTAATVFACVWHNTEPANPYTVKWDTDGSGTKCMKRVGTGGDMEVKESGLTCKNLGKVEVDASGMCYFKESIWEMGYTTTGATYSGSLKSKWTTGPANSDITIKESAAGTSVCGTESKCTGTYIEWSNGKSAVLYVRIMPNLLCPSSDC
jgi:hypothetical protein